MDTVSKEQRSRNMSRIRSTDTKLEVLVRSYLHRRGFRFRKNDKRYPGKPDVLLPKYKAAVFVNGCFWHHHENCPKATIPKSNTDYWLKKFERNKINDQKHIDDLNEMGWRTFVLWECELKKDFEGVMENLIYELKNEKIKED